MNAPLNTQDLYHGDITCRTVKRWYYRNKGYGTKQAAFRKAAKDELWLELAGENWEPCDADAWKQLYRDRFPACDCKMPPARSRVAYGELVFDVECENCAERSFDFCIHNLRAWIKAKAKELGGAA